MLRKDGQKDVSAQPAYLFRVQFQAHTPISPLEPHLCCQCLRLPHGPAVPRVQRRAGGTPTHRASLRAGAAAAPLPFPSREHGWRCLAASPGWEPPGSPWVGSAVTREGMLILFPQTDPLGLRGFRSCESQEQVRCKLTSQCQSMGSQVPPAALRRSQRVQVSRESVSPVQMFWPCPGRWRGRRHCFRPIMTPSRNSWCRDISNDSHSCANCLPVSRMLFTITTMCYWVEVSDICWSNKNQQCNYCI